jgi:hypothetical protein
MYTVVKFIIIFYIIRMVIKFIGEGYNIPTTQSQTRYTKEEKYSNTQNSSFNNTTKQAPKSTFNGGEYVEYEEIK